MTLPYAILFAALTSLASMSPLLTFARLWQIKEWRFDRLREHLRENGWFRQLFGVIRPLLIGILVLLGGLRIFWDTDGVLIGLGVLVIFGLSQLILGRQPQPVWTMKAKALVGGATILVAADSFALIVTADMLPTEWSRLTRTLLLILPLLAPFFLIVSWSLMRPIDMWLKERILKRAENLRVRHPNLHVIGITGSVGKTTVKELLAHILKDMGALSTPERVNTEMGVAAWLIAILKNEPLDSKRILIIEMGAYRKGEIALLCRMAKPGYGIITYVGDQHLSLFGSHEAIIQAKGELFAALPKDGHAFGNSDNDAYETLKKRCLCTVSAVGTGQHADIQATDIEETANGIRFTALGTVFNLPLAGTHNVTGALLAIGVAKEVGMKLSDIAAKLSSFTKISRTFERKKIGDVTVLDDTYNSSPDSVRAAIVWAATQPHTTKILVLEGIIELGDAEGRIHTDLAAIAAPVFTEAYVAHARFLQYLRDGGFGARAHLVTEGSRAQDGTLLVLAGRLSESTMQRFLP